MDAARRHPGPSRPLCGAGIRHPPAARQGKLALVLGAGNVASIAPLDVLHKLFIENQVCLLKLNPVNDYLHDLLAQALAPVIAMDALRIVTGDARAGAWLTTHPAVDEIHITGSRETHDVIVWGEGETARQRRAAGTPLNPRRVTSSWAASAPPLSYPGRGARRTSLFRRSSWRRRR